MARLKRILQSALEDRSVRFLLSTIALAVAVSLVAGFAIGYDILELVEPELIVLRSDPMPEAGMHEPVVLRVEFHDHGAKTRMTLSDGPYPSEGRGHAEAGWNAAFDKLAARVAA